MRITRFEYESTQKKWKLAPVQFSDLTLLVGLSGVGKTRILRAIASLVDVADGKSPPGCKWSISFFDDDGRSCVWSGEFEPLQGWEELSDKFDFMTADDDEPSRKKRARVLRENVSVDGEMLISRTAEKIILKGSPTPKLSPHESVIYLLKEEDELKPVHASFKKIIHADRTLNDGFSSMFATFDSEKLVKKFLNIDSVKASSNAPLTKLFLAHSLKSHIFDEVSERFRSVFPNVEEVSFGSFRDGEGIPYFGHASFVQIKEYGVSEYIRQTDISSGMMRTLVHLAEIFLSPPGTVILIDEFENSLGVNCIDAVTEDLLDSSSSIQFIITSHHPYIINNVSVDYWKIVFRDGALVQTVDASELGIGISSHDSFLQLMNSEQYSGGIAARPS